MKTIHNSQSIRKKDERTAANDPNLTMASVYLLSLINRTIAIRGEFTMTSDEINARWNKFSKWTANRSINELEANGYIKTSYEGDKYNTSRKIDTCDESNKVVDKPHVSVKRDENSKKKVIFEKFWNRYNVKKGKKKSLDKFLKLSLETCKKCLISVEAYIIASPDVKYRKHVLSWLNGEHWNDELTIASVVSNRSNRDADRLQAAKEIADEIRFENEKKERLKNRFNKFGWAKPSANYLDYAEKNLIEKSGNTADIEEIITKRLKREGKQYKK